MHKYIHNNIEIERMRGHSHGAGGDMAGRRPWRSSLEEAEAMEGEKLMAGHGEFDDRGGEGREDIGVSRAAVGVSLEKKEEAVWWVRAASKGRRRRLG